MSFSAPTEPLEVPPPISVLISAPMEPTEMPQATSVRHVTLAVSPAQIPPTFTAQVVPQIPSKPSSQLLQSVQPQSFLPSIIQLNSKMCQSTLFQVGPDGLQLIPCLNSVLSID